MTVSQYLNEPINYGGEPWPRWKVILDLQKKGATQQQIDLWLIGYETGRAIRAALNHKEK